MRNLITRKRNLFGQRRAALRRWRDYRRCRMPQCHMAVADDDFKLFSHETLQHYQRKHDLLVIPLSLMRVHKAGDCKLHYNTQAA